MKLKGLLFVIMATLMQDKRQAPPPNMILQAVIDATATASSMAKLEAESVRLALHAAKETSPEMLQKLLRALFLSPFMHTNVSVIESVCQFCTVHVDCQQLLGDVLEERASSDAQLHCVLEMLHDFLPDEDQE